jgi:hypothetical protein
MLNEQKINIINKANVLKNKALSNPIVSATVSKKYPIFLFLSLFVYIILMALILKKNPKNIIVNHSGLVIMTSLLGAFLFLTITFFMKRRDVFFPKTNGIGNANVKEPFVKPTIGQFLFKLFTVLAGIGFVIFLIYGFSYLYKKFNILSGVLIYTINLLILIGGLAVVYKLLKPLLSKPKNLKMLIVYDFIMYIPCLLNNLIDYIRYQFNITTKPMVLLLELELALIALRVVLPILFQKLINKNGIKLLKEPIYLNTETTLGSHDQLHKNKNKNKTATATDIYDYTYSISAWIYIDPQPPSTNPSYSENTNILSYGKKPQISYNGVNNELIITAMVGNETKDIYKTNDIPYQKWSHIVFNYQGGTLDVFINNKLVSSTANIVPYMSYDNIISGKNYGTYGMIRDVTYFSNVLSKNNISWLYEYEKV